MYRKLDLNEYLIDSSSNTFFVRATGNSMIGAEIEEGSLLMVGGGSVSQIIWQTFIEIKEVEEALAHYTAMTCIKMRAQGSKLHGIFIFVETNYYIEKESFYRNSSSFYFDQAISDTTQIIKYAKRALSKIFKPGRKYKKVGIMLLDLVDKNYNSSKYAQQC